MYFHDMRKLIEEEPSLRHNWKYLYALSWAYTGTKICAVMTFIGLLLLVILSLTDNPWRSYWIFGAVALFSALTGAALLYIGAASVVQLEQAVGMKLPEPIRNHFGIRGEIGEFE